MADLARAIHGIPVVASETERDFLYATPERDQRVQLRTTGEIQRYTGTAWVADAPGGLAGEYDVRAAATPATGNGTTDDRAALAAADTAAQVLGQTLLFRPGTYKIGSNLTITSPVRMLPGAAFSIASGVTLTLAGELRAGLFQIFTGAGNVLFASKGVTTRIDPEWWGADENATVSANTQAIQKAINCSVGITSLTQQSTIFAAPVALNSSYYITTVYLPRWTCLVGMAPKAQLLITSDVPALVLGRSLAENDFLDIVLKDFEIRGDPTKTAQVGIQGAWTGAGAYAYPLRWENLYIRDIGGDGVRIISDSVSSMLIKTSWQNVQVVGAKGYAVRIKVGIFNAAHFEDCAFTDCGNGFYIEDIGGGSTSPSEAIKFQNTQFESLGKFLGTSTYAIGSFGFKSTMYENQISFDSCYFEGNGANPADTTGAHIDVTAPWMVSVTNSLLVTANNAVIMRSGGNVRLEGNYIDAGPSYSSIVKVDGPPRSASLNSTLVFGPNRWAATYSEAQRVWEVNSPRTLVTGYTGTNNYYATPARTRRQVYRDNSAITADAGAIGYSAVKRLTNNADGATSIPNAGIATICANTVSAMVVVTEYNGSRMGLFLLTSGGGVTLVAQRGTSFTTTKDTVTSLNVYHDGANSRFVVQNTLGSGALLAVRFFGCEPMEHADDGYYETQFA